MKPLSLRKRLVVGVVILTTLGLAIADLAGLMLFRAFLLQRVEDQLQTPFGSHPPAEAQTWLNQLCESGRSVNSIQLPTSFAVIVLDANGTVTCQLPQGASLFAQPPAVAELASAADSGTIITIAPTIGRPSASRARVVRLNSSYLVVAISLADVDASVARLARILLTVGLVIVVGASLAGAALVRISLRPLNRIEETAERIASGDLTQRIEVDAPGTEVGRLTTSLNSMLAQIEVAFADREKTEQRLRRFVADASHELRTPLATIRGHAELITTGIASEPAEIATVAGRIESESVRMSALVEDLLLLARLDATRVIEQRPVDLLSIAVDVVADTRVRVPARQVDVANPTAAPWTDTPAIVLGDEGRLQQVLTNLLSNAVKYTPPDTPITVEVGVIDGWSHIAVIDHGPGLQSGNEDRVFERFFREDAGRGRSGGAGLGLAIAWTLVDKHGGTLTYAPTPGGGSTFTVRLPRLEN